MKKIMNKLVLGLFLAVCSFSLMETTKLAPAPVVQAATVNASTTTSKTTTAKQAAALKKEQKAASLVAFAKRFLGNPYVYGGSSLTKGTDCSGFVMALYKHFGYKLPHSSYALRKSGYAVHGGIKNAKPGDIICYSGHVAIYMGKNKVIHASTPSTGIRITKNASYRHIVAIRRII